MIIATFILLFMAIHTRIARYAHDKEQFAGSSFNLNR